MVDPDTTIGGARKRFDTTEWSKIVLTPGEGAEARRRALEHLIRQYWKPVYYYMRLRWGLNNEDCKDLAQQFFAWLIEGDALERVRKDRGRFRAFLRVAVRNFLTNEYHAGRAVKRGGATSLVRLDELGEIESGPLAEGRSPEEAMDREWRNVLVTRALERLEARYREAGKGKCYEVFEAYYVAREPQGTREKVASRFGLSPVDVKNILADGRRGFRRIVRELIAETVTDADGLRLELQALFGRRPMLGD